MTATNATASNSTQSANLQTTATPSFFDTLVADAEAAISKVNSWLNSNPVGQEIKTAVGGFVTELEGLESSVLGQAAVAGSTAAVAAAATSGASSASIISAAVAAAESSFKAQQVTVSVGAISTLASQIAAQVTTPASNTTNTTGTASTSTASSQTQSLVS